MHDVVTYSTASKTLAYQLQKIAAQLGGYAPVYERVNDKGFSAEGALIYISSLYGALQQEILRDGFGRETKPKTSKGRERWWVDADYVYVPVVSVEHKTFDAPQKVINIEVSGDHSYQVQNFSTYNSIFTYNYQIAFELVGGPERVINFGQYYDIIERIKLVALGVAKSFISGEMSFSSAAAGLTVFLQRLKSLREFFVNEWLLPKFFLPLSIANEWIKPSKSQASGGHVRIKRSSQEMIDESMYILPKIEWAKSLDPQVDNERIQAMIALETQLGIKLTDQRKFACLGLDSTDEQQQLLEENKTKHDLAGENMEYQALLGLIPPQGDGGMGGGGGGGGMMPGIPGDAFGLPGDDGAGADTSGGGGDMGAAPPGGAPGAPVAPEGASVSVDADKDGRPSTSDTKPSTPKSPKDEGKGGVEEYWASNVKAPLLSFLDTFEPMELDGHEPWEAFVQSSPTLQKAITTNDPMQVWEALEECMVDENYPSAAITELRDTLTSQRKIGALSQADDSRLERMAAELDVDVNESSTRPDLYLLPSSTTGGLGSPNKTVRRK